MRADRRVLLSGRNHHSVGMGSITETATSAPGNSSLRPNTKAIGWVQIDLGDDDHDHFIDPEERLMIAMASQ